MIKVIDNRTDEVLSDIPKNGNIIEGTHIEDAESKEETLDFTVVSDYEGLTSRNRLLITDDDGYYREFVIENIDEIDEEKTVFSNASYLEDLDNAKPIAPDSKTQLTTLEWVEYATTGTTWEVGNVEFSGVRSISWTGYNSPYELLSIIANRFEMALRFRVEVEYNRVTKRYVDLVHINHLFNGKEIVRGKDLVEFKRQENTEEMATALIALGPQTQDEDGNDLPRLTEIVTDRKANDKYNKPGQFIWKLYEPSTENDSMTRKRLISLAKTELNKRSSPKIDYEISAVNLEQNFGHEKVRKYDKIRIKDVELDRYAEANTKRIERNLLDDSDRNFTFGDIVEYESEDLRKYFNSMLATLQQRLDEAVRNTENIKIDIEDELNSYERKIEKSDTAPDNPKDGDLWLDTSGVTSVLYRFEDGRWVKSSVTEAEEVGAITREEALYTSLINTKESLHVKHLDLQNSVYELLENEYLVDTNIKKALNEQIGQVDKIFTQIEDELSVMDKDTATIGRLINVQALIVEYRNKVQFLSEAIKQANQAIQQRFKLLQSQYSEQKYLDALEAIADRFEGLEVVNGQLVGDISISESVTEIMQEVKDTYLSDVVKKVDYSTDINGIVSRLSGAESSIEQHADMIRQRVTSDELQQEMDGIEVGGRNLIPGTNFKHGEAPPEGWKAWGAGRIRDRIEADDYFLVLTDNPNNSSSGTMGVQTPILTEPVVAGQEYIVTVKANPMAGLEVFDYAYLMNVDGNEGNQGLADIIGVDKGEKRAGQYKIYEYKLVFKPWFSGRARFMFGVYIEKGTYNYFYMTEPQLEKGNQATKYTPAPEDTGETLENLETRLVTNETNIEQTDKRLSLKASNTAINKSHETLSYALSELTLDSRSGLNFTYDSNGIINGYSVGPDGIKLDGSKIDITASEELTLAVRGAQGNALVNDNLIGYTDFWNNPDALTSTHVLTANDESLSKAITLGLDVGKGWLFLKRREGALVYIWTRNHSNNGYPSNRFSVQEGEYYTFSVLYATNWNNPPNYVYMRRESDRRQIRLDINGGDGVERHRYRLGEVNGRIIYKMTYTFKAPFSGNDCFMFFGINNRAETTAGIYISEWKLEKSATATPYTVEMRGDNIVSQINADNSSMRIASNKLSIDASDLKIDAQNIDLVGDVKMVNGRTVINDLTADKISGGILRGQNGNMQVNLNKNEIDFYGESTINFWNEANMFRIVYDSSLSDSRQVISGFGTATNKDGNNFVYFGGAHYNTDGNINANGSGFAGLTVGGGANSARLTGGQVYLGGGNSSSDMAFEVDFTTSLSNRYAYLKPPTSADNYVLGRSNTPFHSVWTWRINSLRFTNLNGHTEIRYDNGSTNGAGFRFTETDVYFVRGGLFSIKEAVSRAEANQKSISNLIDQIRSLANRVYNLEN